MTELTDLAGTGQIDAASNGERSSALVRVKFAIVSLLFIGLYSDVVFSWIQQWWLEEGYSHGFLVLPIVLLIAWNQRQVTLGLPVAPSARGLYVTAGALFLYVLGKLGAEFFLGRVSLVLLICGLILTFWGVARLRHLGFPILLLASVIPPPNILYNKMSEPLQLLASRIATDVAQFLGASVYRDGNVIQLANMTLGVAEACSGLRSLASLTAGALLLGYVERLRPWTRVAVFVLAVPIAIFFNVVRVTGTALLVEQYPELAMGLYHSLSGWLVFLGGFGVLYVAAKLLRSLVERKREVISL